MTIKIHLQSLDNDVRKEDSVGNAYFKEVVYHDSLGINRDGIYFSLFNKIFDPAIAKIPHVTLSRFDLFRDQSEFYTIKTLSGLRLGNDSTFVILFNLNPLEMPLEALGDFLKWFYHYYSSKYPAIKMLAHYNYDLKIKNPMDQKYLLNYFQLIQKHLGKLPELLTHVELEKKSSLENCIIVEAGTQWSCLDNYLVHVALSKGAQLLQPNLDISKFEIMSEHPLSPYHSIVKLKKLESFSFDIVCPFIEDIKDKDFFKHPEELKIFYYLIYINIFKSLEMLDT